MGQNLSPQQLYEFIVNDFESAWDCLASSSSAKGRGNFMFARQAMTLLEFAARLCTSDPLGAALRGVSQTLKQVQPKYFTLLPGACFDTSEFDLPSISLTPQCELLSAMFDLIRNGQAHQYQQILVTLNDGVDFQISLTGADWGYDLQRVRSLPPNSTEHLTFKRDAKKDLWLFVSPALLFLDIKAAIQSSALLQKGLAFQYLSRPRSKSGPFYKFDSCSLEQGLASAGHLLA